MMTAVKRSYDNVDKSQEDKRLYRGLELDNGIKVRENNPIICIVSKPSYHVVVCRFS